MNGSVWRLAPDANRIAKPSSTANGYLAETPIASDIRLPVELPDGRLFLISSKFCEERHTVGRSPACLEGVWDRVAGDKREQPPATTR